jgi:protein Mpv17
MMVTNAVLGGIADTVAQTITSIRQKAVRKGIDSRTDPIAIEIHELDRKNPLNERDLIPDSLALPPPFDFERLTRFMAYGFAMAPIQFKWFRFLARSFPVTKESAFAPAMKRVAFDQLVFAPFGRSLSAAGCAPYFLTKPAGLAVFFTAMTVAEGGGRRAVQNKLRDMYVPTLKANYMVWPAVQVINFRLMPVQFQLVCFPRVTSTANVRALLTLVSLPFQPFVSTVGIAWTAYLSLTNSSDADEQNKVHVSDTPAVRLE